MEIQTRKYTRKNKYLQNIESILPSTYLYVKTVSKRPEGDIYLFRDTSTSPNCQIVVKTRHTCKECLYYEFLVGMELNKLDCPHIVKTLGFYQKQNIGILLLEYLEGITLEDIFSYKSVNTSVSVCLQLLSVLQQINRLTKFTHYDLHEDNVILIESPEPISYRYFLNNSYITIHSNYLIKILDFGAAYIDGIDQQWVELNNLSIYNGMVPSVYDDMYDMATVLGTLFRVLSSIKTLPVVKPLMKLFAINNFNITGSIIRTRGSVGSTLSGRQLTHWDFLYSHIFTPLEKVIHENFYKKFYINKNYTSDCNIMEFKSDLHNYFANFLTESSDNLFNLFNPDNSDNPDILLPNDTIISNMYKQLSDCATYLKLLSIQSRPNTSSDLFESTYQILSSL